jgi:hypothetical protein
MRWNSLVALCVAVTACSNGSPVKPPQSLVGAHQLPSENVLSREIIQINEGVGSWPSAPGALEYELRPDDSLSITHTKTDRASKRLIAGEETLHLSSSTASQARLMLWRLHPETLQGIQVVVRPTGCPPPPVDSAPQFFVDFISKGPRAGIADDKLGIVFVPHGEDCRTPKGAEARALVQSVLQSFPRSKVVTDFQNEVSRWEGNLRS